MSNTSKRNRDSDPLTRSRPRRSKAYLKWTAGIAAGLTCVVVLGCVALVAMVNTAGVHKYVLDLAQQKASEALGVPVRLENFAVRPGSLSVDLYGIRIAGASPYADPPLLQADHVEVRAQIVSIPGRKWHFERVQIDHPVAWVVVDKSGASNLPVFRSEGSSKTDLFDLGIRHFEITRGEVYYNSRSSALAAQVKDLAFISTFNSLLTRYNGKLAYSNGILTIGSLRPLQHDFDTEFEATRGQFTIKSARISSGASSASLNAALTNYSSPSIRAQYRIVLDGRQTAQILQQSQMPAGSVLLSGSVQYEQSASRSVIQSLLIDGDLASSRLRLDTPSVHAGLTNLRAHYSLDKGNVTLRELHAEALGGAIMARGTMNAIEGKTQSTFEVDLQNASLAQARQAFVHSAAMNSVSLNGMASATAKLSWGDSIDNLVAHADVTVNGEATRLPAVQAAGKSAAPNVASASVGRVTVPVQAALHGTYSQADRSLALSNSYLKTSQSSVSLNGTISRQASLAVTVEANDLSEAAVLADLFRTDDSGAQSLDLAGRASFQGTVHGSTSAPSLNGQLTAQNLEYSGTHWKTLRTGIEVSPNRAALHDLHLESADRGQVIGSASAGLQNWSFAKTNPVQVDLSASGFNTELIEKLAGTQFPVTGNLSLNAHLHGTALNPAGTANVKLSQATAYGEPITEAHVDVSGSGNSVSATAAIQLPAGTIQARGTVDPSNRTFDAHVSSSGIDLAKLQTARKSGIETSGVLTIQAQGQGSFDDPAMDARVEIPRLATAGQVFTQTVLHVTAQNRIADVDLASSVANAPLHGKAKVNLTGDYLADASLDTQTLPLEPFLAAYAPGGAADLRGQTEIHAQVHGPLKQWKQVEGSVTIPVLKVAYSNKIQMTTSPIRAELHAETITLQPAKIQGPGTELEIQGAFPISGDAAASFKAQGTIDLQIAQMFDPDLRTSGLLKVNLDMAGTAAAPTYGGQVEIADANFSTDASPIGLQHGNGVLKLTADRLQIAQFTGTLGGGAVTAQGSILYRPALRFDLGFAAKGARMLYPQGLRETADANLRLAGSMSHATLSGTVNLTDLSFTPAFDLASFIDQFSGGVEVPQEPGFAQNLDLNVGLSSAGNTNLVSRTLSVSGTANLQIRGTAANPVILGRVNLASGDVILNGDRFLLTGGTVQFINPSITEPVLNVALTTAIQQYKIDLRFRGPASQLHTQYTSDPSLPSADIINLLAFGQTTEASAMNATPLSQQAQGLVASQVSSQVTSRISKAAGISQLSISPVLAGGTAAGPPGATVTIQQRVAGNLFVTFSSNVASTQGQTIQGQYQVSPRVAVSGTLDPNGGFAFDTLIKKSW